VALRLAGRRDTVEPVTVPARRRVVLLAATAAGLDALERALGPRDDVHIVARVTRVAEAIAVDADLVVAQPAALSAAPGGTAGAGATGPGPAASDLPAEALTPRELDVLGLLAEGRGNRDIAAALGISEHTVKFHLASIFGKLGVSTRTGAVQRALKLGAIQL
jgi:DNA-binding CsgD family transcriptional regulator